MKFPNKKHPRRQAEFMLSIYREILIIPRFWRYRFTYNTGGCRMYHFTFDGRQWITFDLYLRFGAAFRSNQSWIFIHGLLPSLQNLSSRISTGRSAVTSSLTVDSWTLVTSLKKINEFFSILLIIFFVLLLHAPHPH